MTDANHRKIILKRQAIAAGLKRYFTGKPCPHGHICERHIDGHCIECARIKNKKRKYDKVKRSTINKAWREKRTPEYKERQAKKMREWRMANKERVKQWVEKNKEKIKQKSKAWRAANPDKVKKYKTIEYINNKNKRIAKVNEWQASNQDRVKSYRTNHKAMRRKAVGKHTAKEIKDLMNRQGNKCAECKCNISIKKTPKIAHAHLDHIVPISIGGSNLIKNLQYLCLGCNLSKGALDPLEWAKRNNRLL
jgi:hypothetical protein